MQKNAPLCTDLSQPRKDLSFRLNLCPDPLIARGSSKSTSIAFPTSCGGTAAAAGVLVIEEKIRAKEQKKKTLIIYL